MRVLVVGVEKADWFEHNIAFTLRTMGHEVFSMPASFAVPPNSFSARIADRALSYLSQNWLLRVDRWAINASQIIKPCLTIVCNARLHPESVAAIKTRSGGKVICWYGDSPVTLKEIRVVSGEYDAVFMKDAEFIARARSMLGIEIHHIDEACNPAWHRPVAEKNNDHIIIAGNSYGFRNAFTLRLLNAGQNITLYGCKPPLWVPDRVRSAHTGIYLDEKSKAKAFGGALACLNTFALTDKNMLNCRVFETCACGGLLLSERQEAIKRCFDPGKEYLDFGSFEECLEIISRLKTDYSHASEIRKAAVRRAHGEHTYEHRLKQIFKIIGMR